MIFQDSKNTVIRHNQHVLLNDIDFSNRIAKDIVRGKIHNQYLYLQRINIKQEEKKYDEIICKFKKIRNTLEVAKDIEEIRGIEGFCSMLFFICYSSNFNCKWTSFNGRNKNPPKDPINAVLSFLYTVLANKIHSFLIIEGLDASIGFLHTLSYGRTSLVYDLIEEYRTPIVESLTCSLFNLGVFNNTDFTDELTDDENWDTSKEEDNKTNKVGVYLTEVGMKKTLSHFEKKLMTEHKYELKNKVLTYESIIHEQIKHYKKVLNGECAHYIPLEVV